jgi:hypothetical protein
MAHKLERKSMRKLLMILSIFTTVSVYADSDINSDQAIADCARENKNCDRINAAIKRMLRSCAMFSASNIAE